jgi:cytochrome P450
VRETSHSITTTPASATVTDLMAELATPAGQAAPYPIYSRLRALGDAVSGPDDALIVTGYRACSTLLREPRLRKNPERLLVAAGFADWEQRPALRTMFTSILMLNPPEHTRLRALVSGVFTARRVAELRPAVEGIADRLCDELDGPADFIDAIAFPFPVTVIGELLGVPPADRAMFRGLVTDWSMVLELLNSPTVERADEAATAIIDYFRELSARRRAEPQGDLISALVSAADGDQPALSDDELVQMAALILAAGFETTTGLLANGLVALLEHPAQAERLRREPKLAKPAVEELLRYDAPVQMIYGRTAVDDLIVGNLALRAGQRVITLLGAANRDPQVFTSPDELVLDRDEGAVLSFGAGIHHCLGAALARLEAQVILPELLRRFPRLCLTDGAQRRPGIAIHSYRKLPIDSRG